MTQQTTHAGRHTENPKSVHIHVKRVQQARTYRDVSTGFRQYLHRHTQGTNSFQLIFHTDCFLYTSLHIYEQEKLKKKSSGNKKLEGKCEENVNEVLLKQPQRLRNKCNCGVLHLKLNFEQIFGMF